MFKHINDRGYPVRASVTVRPESLRTLSWAHLLTNFLPHVLPGLHDDVPLGFVFSTTELWVGEGECPAVAERDISRKMGVMSGLIVGGALEEASLCIPPLQAAEKAQCHYDKACSSEEASLCIPSHFKQL
jgi:hypothetical protein